MYHEQKYIDREKTNYVKLNDDKLTELTRTSVLTEKKQPSGERHTGRDSEIRRCKFS